LTVPSGAISPCKSNLCRRRCPHRSMYPLYLQVDHPYTWVNQSACGVSSSYDALVELFERVGDFLTRLHIYTEVPFIPSMTGIIVRIMVEVLSVLGLATKEIKRGRVSESILVIKSVIYRDSVEKFVKKLLGESKIESVLQRLAQLIDEESRMATALTLREVHDIGSKIVMNGTRHLHCCLLNVLEL
jgi:hypothetical protein